MNTVLSLTAILFFPGGLFLLASGLAYEWADRKLVARFQNRVGPRWFQPLADAVKLLAKDETAVVDAKELESVAVEGKVIALEKAKKIIVLKFKRRKGYKRKQGHRQKLTKLEITKIRT